MMTTESCIVGFVTGMSWLLSDQDPMLTVVGFTASCAALLISFLFNLNNFK